MTDLPTTGPPALTLKWGQETVERDGRLERAFYPDTALHEPDGYLHGGAAAAAVLSAARLLVPAAGEPTSVALSLREPVPLGDDLVVSLSDGDGTADVTIGRVLPADRESEVTEDLAFGTVTLDGPRDADDLADARQLAIVPIPEPQEHELFAGCYVCGQANPRGLQLLPGWHAPDRVVVSFIAQDRYVEGGRKGEVAPEAVCALLSCPTLWAVAGQLDDRPEDGALLASYSVDFHATPRTNTVLRTVAWAGRSGRHTEFPEHLADRQLHAVSALVDEDGTLYATAAATWVTVEEVPAREPGRPAPRYELMPEKAGRPEERSRGGWGVSAPGRRESPGPRSWRPGSTPAPGRGAGQTDRQEKGEPRLPKKGHPHPQDEVVE